MPLTPSTLSPIDPAVFSPAADRTSPADGPVTRTVRPGAFLSANLNAPTVKAHQGIQHRLGRSLCGLVIRIVQRACFRLQARKRVVTTVSAAYSLGVHCSSLPPCSQHTTDGSADVQNLFAGSANGHV